MSKIRYVYHADNFVLIAAIVGKTIKDIMIFYNRKYGKGFGITEDLALLKNNGFCIFLCAPEETDD